MCSGWLSSCSRIRFPCCCLTLFYSNISVSFTRKCSRLFDSCVRNRNSAVFCILWSSKESSSGCCCGPPALQPRISVYQNKRAHGERVDGAPRSERRLSAAPTDPQVDNDSRCADGRTADTMMLRETPAAPERLAGRSAAKIGAGGREAHFLTGKLYLKDGTKSNKKGCVSFLFVQSHRVT